MDTKLFKCDICNKTFTVKRSLIRHNLSHSPRLPSLTCHKCDKNFSRLDSLKRHKKKCDLKKAAEDKNRLELDMVVRTCVCDESLDMNSLTLCPWQTRVLTFATVPTYRKIIFVIGENGNEGKNFLQKYILQRYGTTSVHYSIWKIKGENLTCVM